MLLCVSYYEKTMKVNNNAKGGIHGGSMSNGETDSPSKVLEMYHRQ
jgi:hypothetical protein